MKRQYIYKLGDSPAQVGVDDGDSVSWQNAPSLTTAPGALVLALLAKGKADRRFLERNFFSRTLGINQNGVAKLAQRTRELMNECFGEARWVRQSQLDIFFTEGEHYCDVVNGPFNDSRSRFGSAYAETLKRAKANLDSFSSDLAWIKEYKRWLCTAGNESEMIYADSEECKTARHIILTRIDETGTVGKHSFHSGNRKVLVAFVDIDGTSNLLNQIDSPIQLDKALSRITKVLFSRCNIGLSRYGHNILEVQRWGYDAYCILLVADSPVPTGLFVSIVQGAVEQTINELTSMWVNASFGLHTISGASAAQELAAAILGCRESKRRKRAFTITKPLLTDMVGWGERLEAPQGVTMKRYPELSEGDLGAHDANLIRKRSLIKPGPQATRFSKVEIDEIDLSSIDESNQAWLTELKYQSDSLYQEPAEDHRFRVSDTTNLYFPVIPFETRQFSVGDARTFVEGSGS